jgi:hypothetical protein
MNNIITMSTAAAGAIFATQIKNPFGKSIGLTISKKISGGDNFAKTANTYKGPGTKKNIYRRRTP